MNARHELTRALSVGAAGTVVAAIGLVAAVPSHAAAETYPRPEGTTITLSGHGFGHGHGMSQWGAYGAAKVAKLSWKSILSHYYPGTTLSNHGNPTIRVRLDAAGHGPVYLPTPAGLRLAGSPLPAAIAGLPVTAYRVSPRSEGGVTVDALSAAGWTLYQNQASPAVLTNPSRGNVVDVRLPDGKTRSYRGSILAHRVTATSITPVSVVPMESYLPAVVPVEMPASWHPNALAAQAVAARSFANYSLANARASSISDTCDDHYCQTYAGMSAEHPASNTAVEVTAGQTLTYGGKAAETQFGAANGGWNSSGGQPYLAAAADPYDGAITNSANSWTKSITVASIQARWPSIGTYTQLRVISRDGQGEWGGRVLKAAVDGSAGSVTVSGKTIASAFGLRSEWFIPTIALPAPAPAPPVAAPTAAPAAAPLAWAVTRYTPYKELSLKQGSKGAAVTVLQQALNLTADGQFGPKTQTAVVAYQKQQGLLANGIVSRPVWDGLEKRDYPLIAYRALTLKQGSSGSVTVVLQRALRVSADGDFGAKTAAAVRAVQASARVAQTGVVSGWTWVAIENRMPR